MLMSNHIRATVGLQDTTVVQRTKLEEQQQLARMATAKSIAAYAQSEQAQQHHGTATPL
jgi:hypothetical protein